MTLKEVQDQLDTEGLRTIIINKLKFVVPGLQIEVQEAPEGMRGAGNILIKVSSDNIASVCGPLQAVMGEVTIDDFGSCVFEHKEEGWCAWVSVHFSWKHQQGGSNGHSWFDAFYKFNEKKWTTKEGC